MLAPLITFPLSLVEPEKENLHGLLLSRSRFLLVVKTILADFHFIPLLQMKPAKGACVDGDPLPATDLYLISR